jgi:hypothetical protein
MTTQNNAPAIITGKAVPLPGEYWDGNGGFYTGLLRNPANNQRWHVITHPNAVAPNAWGPYGKKISNCDSVHDGAANSQAMKNSGHSHPVLEAIYAMEQDGCTDFYLPAQRENNLICINLPDHCDPVYHWSSTQFDASSAWCQGFEYGYQDIDFKGNQRAARAVRRILIIE